MIAWEITLPNIAPESKIDSAESLMPGDSMARRKKASGYQIRSLGTPKPISQEEFDRVVLPIFASAIIADPALLDRITHDALERLRHCVARFGVRRDWVSEELFHDIADYDSCLRQLVDMGDVAVATTASGKVYRLRARGALYWRSLSPPY